MVLLAGALISRTHIVLKTRSAIAGTAAGILHPAVHQTQRWLPCEQHDVPAAANVNVTSFAVSSSLSVGKVMIPIFVIDAFMCGAACFTGCIDRGRVFDACLAFCGFLVMICARFCASALRAVLIDLSLCAGNSVAAELRSHALLVRWPLGHVSSAHYASLSFIFSVL